jgi:hypothetical protein
MNEPTTFDLYAACYQNEWIDPAKAKPTVSTHDMVVAPLVVEWRDESVDNEP